MHSESCNDQKREEDIKGEGDRKIWETGSNGSAAPEVTFRFQDQADEHNTRRYIREVSRRCYCKLVESALKEARYTTHGKAMTQSFLL